MHHFGMKLHGEERSVAMTHGCELARLGGGQYFEPRRNGFDHIAVVHPDLGVAVNICKESVWLPMVENRVPVFAALTWTYGPAQLVSHELQAITDPEHGHI